MIVFIYVTSKRQYTSTETNTCTQNLDGHMQSVMHKKIKSDHAHAYITINHLKTAKQCKKNNKILLNSMQ
jgi:hypothetical protein